MDYSSYIVLPKEGKIYSILDTVASEAKIVCFTGLPGVGKSLYVQQFAYMALEKNRKISILQWDGARQGFETEQVLKIYPEIDGVTHAGIRKSCGLWSRKAVYNWYQLHKNDNEVLILEAPLVGNRLIELGKKTKDELEPILSSNSTQFILPVPSDELRKLIISKRVKTAKNPNHEMEKADAQPHVLMALYREICEVGKELGMKEQLNENNEYDASFYESLYRKVLRARHVKTLFVNEVFEVNSAYDIRQKFSKMAPSTEEVSYFISLVQEKYPTDEQLEIAVNNWYVLK
ncbi:type 1 periplasmic-binding domain-containing protein [Aquimarina megaterium]|uniref:hypothetical protein n=1 Tax=Aquimarina megaterium TaxID=1443666 RepID=UPI00046F560E|nr:hypothetical protein [Aquimarina megaterium]